MGWLYVAVGGGIGALLRYGMSGWIQGWTAGPFPWGTMTVNVLRLSTDLPVIVEVVEREGKIQEVLPDLDGMIGGGLITLERARVIMYRPEEVPEEEPWQHRIEGLEKDDTEDREA